MTEGEISQMVKDGFAQKAKEAHEDVGDQTDHTEPEVK